MIRTMTSLIAAIGFSMELHAAAPLGLPPLPVPPDNPQSADKSALGRLLFNDRRFSADGTVSCASCHQPRRAFTDALPVARGIGQAQGTRNSPTVVNAAYYTTLFLDGRRDSLETQALDPLLNPIEHGLSDHRVVVDVIRGDDDYRARFRSVFGIASSEITIDHVAKAIASYERTLISGDSPFDRYFFGGDRTALSASAARGLNVFRRKGNCANCHEISWNNALLTDNRFYNIGVGFGRVEPVIDDILEGKREIGGAGRSGLTARQRSELGRFAVTRNRAEIGAFRTPTLRNIERTGPYMHDGSIESLAAVVDYYDRGGDKNRWLDPAIFPLHLTDQEKADLVAFLKSLTSPVIPR